MFTSSTLPDTLTMSLYSRPSTQAGYFSLITPLTGLFPNHPPQNILSTRDLKLKKAFQQPDLFQTRDMKELKQVRPKTVGYSFSPQRKLYGHPQLMIEDRQVHIDGSRLELQEEIRSIEQHFVRQSAQNAKTNKRPPSSSGAFPVSMATL